MDEQPPDWSAVFDALAPGYDQSGVPFFAPIAQALANRLEVVAGDRVAELGCGRGALTLALADAVGPGGRVDALDLSPRMADLARAATAAHPQVTVAVGDAADPALPGSSYDAVTASLVLFFLPDPLAAVRRWRELVAPGGRAGVTTFAEPTPSWRAMEAAFTDALGQAPGGHDGPFATDAGVEELFGRAGWRAARTEVTVHEVPFRDLAQWEEFMLGTALRGLWAQLDETGRGRVRGAMGELLATEGGRIEVAIRHTLARG